MSDAWLIYNFGTQEPWIQLEDQVFSLKDREGPIRRALGNSEGLWNLARIVFEAPPEKYALSFPILEPALKHAKGKAGGCLARVKLIATNSARREGLRPGDPRNDDTYWAAKLAQRWVERQEGVAAVDVVPLAGDNPHVYGNAKRFLGKAKLLEGLSEDTRIYVCASPGLPAVNAAVLQHVLHTHSSRCFVFQVQKPEDDVAVVERVAETDLFLDMAARQLKALVDEFQYESGLSLLEKLPAGPGQSTDQIRELLETALRAWNLEFTMDQAPPWEQKYPPRIYQAFQIGAALLESERHLNDAVSWLADGFEFFRVFLYAHKVNVETYLTTRQKPPDDWRNVVNELPFGTGLGCFEPLQTFRNTFVHRLKGTTSSDVVSALRKSGALGKSEDLASVSGKLEKYLDAAVRELGLGDPSQIKASIVDFLELNIRLTAAINRDLIGIEE